MRAVAHPSRRQLAVMVATGLLLCAAVAGRSVAGRSATIDPSLAALLPGSAQLEAWTTDEGPVAYGPDDLYEYMDGGAERYLGYGFRSLVHARYCLRDEPSACVTLDLFDMGADLGAFGIYRSVLSSTAAPRDWGAEGNENGAIASCWRGSVFVHAEADDERPALIEMMETLVANACARAAGGDSLPAILDPLPRDALVVQSERYVASDLLGFSFLPGGVLATYKLAGREGELFFSDTGSEGAALDAIARLRAHHAKKGTLVRSLPAVGPGLRFTESPQGTGTFVTHARFVTGVHGDLPYATQERLLTALHARLDRTTQTK